MNKDLGRSIGQSLLALAILISFSSCMYGKDTKATSEGVDTEPSVIQEQGQEESDLSIEKSHPTGIENSYPMGVMALMESYPNYVKGYNNGNILLNDGSEIVYDDGKEKDFKTMLDNSDIEDMFYVAYRLPEGAPEYLEDAGRSRNEALFKKMYGASASAVERHLVNVPWFGQTVKFTSINGAADQLKKVAKELSQYPELKKYLKSSGTFYWRPVRGAKRMSAHSYGIAFDIGVDQSDYWLWKNPNVSETQKIKYSNRIPKKIVEIFQKYGFIWGGAWYHFDTMHFEYRPEILKYAELNQQ